MTLLRNCAISISAITPDVPQAPTEQHPRMRHLHVPGSLPQQLQIDKGLEPIGTITVELQPVHALRAKDRDPFSIRIEPLHT